MVGLTVVGIFSPCMSFNSCSTQSGVALGGGCAVALALPVVLDVGLTFGFLVGVVFMINSAN